MIAEPKCVYYDNDDILSSGQFLGLGIDFRAIIPNRNGEIMT